MDLNKYIGVPYLPGGRDPARGLDCYGLVRAVYRELGRELPDWQGDSEDLRAVTNSLLHAVDAEEYAVPVERPENYDFVLVKRRALPWHIGVYLQGSVLHAERGVGVSFVELGRFLQAQGPNVEYARWAR